jgi:hypothetical protein
MARRQEAVRFDFGISGASLRAPDARLRPFTALTAVSGKDHPGLMTIAFKVASSFPEEALQRIFSAASDRFHSVHSMLATTAYHYTLGFFGSEEIARRLRDGSPAQWPSPERPDGNSIRRFRNRNRLCVQQALERCLLSFCESLGADTESCAPHFIRVIKAEARMRVHQAELADLESEF